MWEGGVFEGESVGWAGGVIDRRVVGAGVLRFFLEGARGIFWWGVCLFSCCGRVWMCICLAFGGARR